VARQPRGAGFSERHRFAGYVLELDGHVLQHVSKPGAFVFGKAPDESTRLAVGAAVLPEAGQCAQQRINEPRSEPAGGPVLECPEIQFQANDGKMSVCARADVDRAFEDAHGLGSGVDGSKVRSVLGFR
jgi:hypothetical protein